MNGSQVATFVCLPVVAITIGLIIGLVNAIRARDFSLWPIFSKPLVVLGVYVAFLVIVVVITSYADFSSASRSHFHSWAAQWPDHGSLATLWHFLLGFFGYLVQVLKLLTGPFWVIPVVYIIYRVIRSVYYYVVDFHT